MRLRRGAPRAAARLTAFRLPPPSAPTPNHRARSGFTLLAADCSAVRSILAYKHDEDKVRMLAPARAGEEAARRRARPRSAP